MDYILILGASSDIAKPLALHYAKAGYGLHVTTKSIDKSDRLKKDLAIRTNTEIKTSVYDAEQPDTAAACWAALDPKPVGVICLIGYLGDEKKAQEDFKEAKRIIDSNYTGCVAFLQQAANHFTDIYSKQLDFRVGASERGEGVYKDNHDRAKRACNTAENSSAKSIQEGFIVGVSSVAGDRGRGSNYYYGSAKAGFTAFLSGLRNQLSTLKVPVLTVKPGFIATKMTGHLTLPTLLTATPEQVASAIFKAQQKKRSVIYVKPIWFFIMSLIQHIPDCIFKRLTL